jgi:hypothetical protein
VARRRRVSPGDGPSENEIGALSAEGDGVFVLNLFVKGLDNRIYWNPVQL